MKRWIHATTQQAESLSDIIRSTLSQACQSVFNDSDCFRLDRFSNDRLMHFETDITGIVPKDQKFAIKLPDDISTKSDIKQFLQDYLIDLQSSKTIVAEPDFNQTEQYIETVVLPKLSERVNKIANQFNITVELKSKTPHLSYIINKDWSAAAVEVNIMITSIDNLPVENMNVVGYDNVGHYLRIRTIWIPLNNLSMCTDNSSSMGLVPIEKFCEDQFDKVLDIFDEIIQFNNKLEDLDADLTDFCNEFKHKYSDRYPGLSITYKTYTGKYNSIEIIFLIECYNNQIRFNVQYSADSFYSNQNKLKWDIVDLIDYKVNAMD